MRTLADVLRRIGAVLDSTPNDELNDPNQPGLFGNRPLNIAARWGDLEAIKILLAAGAEIDGKGEDGFAPLHDAIDEGQLGAVELLLKNGASLTCTNDDGDTPLEYAKSMRKDEIVAFIDAFRSDKT